MRCHLASWRRERREPLAWVKLPAQRRAVAPPAVSRRNLWPPGACDTRSAYMLLALHRDAARATSATKHAQRKSPSIRMGRKGITSLRGSTHIPREPNKASRAWWADNGAGRGGLLLLCEPEASQGAGSAPGERVVFAVAHARNGSQPLAVPRCWGAAGTRPAHCSRYRQHTTWRARCKGGGQAR